jgi:hypothetical protein
MKTITIETLNLINRLEEIAFYLHINEKDTYLGGHAVNIKKIKLNGEIYDKKMWLQVWFAYSMYPNPVKKLHKSFCEL